MALAILFELTGTTSNEAICGIYNDLTIFLMFVLYGCSFTFLNFALTLY
nr:hypothetical protein [Paenibacillus aceris]